MNDTRQVQNNWHSELLMLMEHYRWSAHCMKNEDGYYYKVVVGEEQGWVEAPRLIDALEKALSCQKDWSTNKNFVPHRGISGTVE